MRSFRMFRNFKNFFREQEVILKCFEFLCGESELKRCVKKLVNPKI
uniref:Uncharacterized protein n=1 Tax=Rhizophora mucronata TaxID=61149 RepID=A0A2P2NET7_RHIMU